jgi:hypothetical protein
MFPAFTGTPVSPNTLFLGLYHMYPHFDPFHHYWTIITFSAVTHISEVLWEVSTHTN